MKFGTFCIASLITSASSFTLFPSSSSSSSKYGLGLRKNQSQLESTAGDDALFGAKVPGMPDKVPPPPPVDEDNPMGGQMFRQMMERAKKGPSRPPRSTSDEGQYNQPQQSLNQQPNPNGYMQPQPQQPLQQPAMDQYAAYQLQLQAWQQQMTAFAQFSAANPQAAATMTMPPPPPPPQAQPQQQPVPPLPVPPVGVQEKKEMTPYDYLPKGDGRNSQAFEVNNAADVYFAQLKRDSTIRTLARKQGDLDTANKPFADEGVKMIGNLLSDELIASRREQLKRSGGEFETSRDEMILPSHFQDYETVDKSYTGVSYKQKLMDAKNKKGASATGGSEQSNVNVAETSNNVVSSTSSASSFVPQVKPLTIDSATTTKSLETSTEPPSTGQIESEQPNFALEVKDESQIQSIAAPSMEDSEEDRQSIRTLMGLLLKHRGGPGFGHGRLQGTEAEKLENMTGEVLALLQKENGNEGKIDNVPSTGNAAVSSSTSQSSPLLGAVTCVDAALNMYKNADEAGKKELMLPLRDALLSAVESMNKVISEETLNSDNVNRVQPEPAQASAPVYATTMDFPETYQVSTQQDEAEHEEITNIITSGGGELRSNNEKLQNAYNVLKAMTGDQKFGLRNVNQQEIQNARKVLSDMREVLMEELQ